MIGQYINCYTLGRCVPGQEHLQYVLPCDQEKAVKLFALFINEKGILQPRKRLHPTSVADTGLSICRLSEHAMATFLWRSGYLSQSRQPVIRILSRIVYSLTLFRTLYRREKAIDEVVLELFHSSQGHLPCVTLSHPDTPPPDLLLGRLHFATISPQQTMLRIFIGWTDVTPLPALHTLYMLLQQYMALLHQVLLPTPPSSPQATTGTNGLDGLLAERPVSDFQAVVGKQIGEPVMSGGQKTTAGVTTESPAETNASSTLSDWQIEDNSELDLLHQGTVFQMPSPVSEEGMVAAQVAPAGESGHKPAAAKEPTQLIPPPSEDEKQLYRHLKPPRLYPKTLTNICIMVAERQRQIDTRGQIPSMVSFKKPLRPSRNTLRKIPELVTHWHDIRYRWNVVTWLHHHSGFSDAEISEIYSHLRHHLADDVWQVVAAESPAS